MSSLEERLNWLEGQVKTHDALLLSRNNDIVAPISVTVRSSNRRAVDAQDTAPFNQFVLQEESQEDMVTDGMAITFVSEDDSGFFGA
jgi:hypothetical protein